MTRKSVQNGYCAGGGDYHCALERSECTDATSFRSSREMQGAPERAHGGVCLLQESMLGKPLGDCSISGTPPNATTCAPNPAACKDDEVFQSGVKPLEGIFNPSGCVVENSVFGKCGDRCSWSPDDCAGGEDWTFPAEECRCDYVQVGGCTKDDQLFCAVSSDACDAKSTYLNPLQVAAENPFTCYLCRKMAGYVEEEIEDENKDSDLEATNGGSEEDASAFTTLSAKIDVYPEFQTIFDTPSGVVAISFYENGDLTIALDAQDLPASCSDSNMNTNGCGVHIHEGTSCDRAALIGGHFYKNSAVESVTDPWANVRYFSDTDGVSTSRAMGDGMNTKTILLRGGSGYGAEENVGQAVVVHDANGGRIGCGLLGTAKISVDDSVDEIPSLTASQSIKDNTLLFGGIVGGVLGVVFVGVLFTVLYRRTVRKKTNSTEARAPLKTIKMKQADGVDIDDMRML